MNIFVSTRIKKCCIVIFCLLCISLLGQQATARKRSKSGARGEIWKPNQYASETLAMIQGATHKLWSKQTKGWMHPQPKSNGAVLEEWWCKGADVTEHTCRSGSVAGKRTRGVFWRGMGGELTEGVVDRLWLSIGMIPNEGVWGVVLYLDLGGRPLQVEQFEIQFLRLANDAVTERLLFSPVLNYSIEKSDFKVEMESIHLAYTQISESPEGLSQMASHQLGQLLSKVQEALKQGRVQKCAYGRYHGNDPPPCKLIPIDSEEAEDWHYFVEREIQQRIALIRAEDDVLFSILSSLLPSELTGKSILID